MNIYNKNPKIIKELGYLFPNETSKRKSPYVIVECSICKKHFKTIKSKNTNNKCSCCSKVLPIRKIKHKQSNSRIYTTWTAMKQRCLNNNHYRYSDWGGRNISILKEWENFDAFYEWSINNGYEENLTLDRINNDEGYYPDNCRWVTYTTQSRNTRRIISTNTSGYRGVSLFKSVNKYRAYIVVNYKQIHLKYYSTALEAAKAYDTYVIQNNLEHTLNNVLTQEEINQIKK